MGVSVIIPAYNQAENLRSFLPAYLGQDMQDLEVIVVNMASQDSTREVIEDFMHRDSRVRMTFIPTYAQPSDARRLALTLGARAAQNEVLVIAPADAVPSSPRYLKAITSPLSDLRMEAVVAPTRRFVRPGNSRQRRLLKWTQRMLRLQFALHSPSLGRWSVQESSNTSIAIRRSFYIRMLRDEHMLWNHNTCLIDNPDSALWIY